MPKARARYDSSAAKASKDRRTLGPNPQGIMVYARHDAGEMLDLLIHEHVVTRAELVRGSIVLALHAHFAGVSGAVDVGLLLADLESLILGDIVGFDAA